MAVIGIAVLVAVLAAVLISPVLGSRPDDSAAVAGGSGADRPLLFGASAGDRAAIERTESDLGRTLSGIRIFRRWGAELIDAQAGIRETRTMMEARFATAADLIIEPGRASYAALGTTQPQSLYFGGISTFVQDGATHTRLAFAGPAGLTLDGWRANVFRGECKDGQQCLVLLW